MSERLARLIEWQAQCKRHSGYRIHAIVHGFCQFLTGSGLPVCRVTIALATLHPQIQALRYVWYDDERDPGPFPAPTLFHRDIHHIDGCTIDEALMSHGARGGPAYMRSPFYRLEQEGLEALDFRLSEMTGNAFPILDELAAQGATHYVAYPLPGAEGQISVATRAADGFGASDLQFLQQAICSLALLLDAAVKELVLGTVLECYVGGLPSREILRGNIRPGAMLDLSGAIWFSDIRGFSTHAQALPPIEFIASLNAYYECVVPIIYRHGGEVLKFIGDAVLAIFADRGDGDQDACARALAAVEASNKALLDRRIAFDHGVGLHVGRFQFGNIGSLRRLDFTVIGNEVNVAARIEAQCKVHRERVLMSQAFSSQCGLPVRTVARVPLKGIEGEFSLHAPT